MFSTMTILLCIKFANINVSCYILWAYSGFCQNNEMEIDNSLPIWKGDFHYTL